MISTHTNLETTVQMIENGIQILRDSPSTDIALKALSMIAAIVAHQETKIRATETNHNNDDDEIMQVLLRV